MILVVPLLRTTLAAVLNCKCILTITEWQQGSYNTIIYGITKIENDGNIVNFN